MTIRILIIEDHADNLDLMTYLLNAFGYSTLSARDGNTGIEAAGREKPELIICDIQLPGIDGYEIAKRLKRDDELRAIPLIGITALAMVGDRERVLSAGFDGYIAKPIAPETFVGEVEAFLRPEQRSTTRQERAAESRPEVNADMTSRAPVPMRGTILVVDNVDANLQLARSIFEPSGYTVLLASDVASAIECANRSQPDLILSDLNMPHASGFELAMRVKSDPHLQGVPVVLISGTAPRDMSGDYAMSVGAAKFLRRPIDPKDLLKEVEGCLQASRRSRA